MTDTTLIPLVYLGGVIIAAVIIGFCNDDFEDNLAPMWFVSALWPLILTAIFGAAFMYGPFWIGRKLRGLFS